MKSHRPLVALLLAAVTAITASCVNRDAEIPLAARRLLDLGGGPGLLACTPSTADSVTQLIGPAGGTIQFGPHTLVIPAGALDSTVAITAVAPSDTLNRAVFSPAGLQFQQPASLTMSYANCGIIGSLLPRQIAYTTDLLQVLEYIGGTNDILGQTVSAPIHHFSDYVVAW
jgi:hypothetical protein